MRVYECEGDTHPPASPPDLTPPVSPPAMARAVLVNARVDAGRVTLRRVCRYMVGSFEVKLTTRSWNALYGL